MKKTTEYPKLGEIWYINLNPTKGHEQAKTRPCLVVSHNTFNKTSRLCVILPITSRHKKQPLHVKIEPPEGGLPKKSYIMCDQIRTVSHLRMRGKSLGTISQSTLRHVQTTLGHLLDL